MTKIKRVGAGAVHRVIESASSRCNGAVWIIITRKQYYDRAHMTKAVNAQVSSKVMLRVAGFDSRLETL